ncbi:hypothetical protein PFLUV_G00051740 [Perca fluviatilis]|uniref:MKRN2 opposite strand protein n=1 Tax=Perca fluviatilis TaxID=8168 RepID=A0A6A5ES95_PERFL|nr:hypothetical protein PFLUV_G00051740 [Perca fluviatilis]
MDVCVIRVSHCEKEIFCFSVPEECPSCGEQLRGSRLQEAPSGVVRDQSGWESCVSVPLVRPDMFPLLAQWDRYLDQFSDGPMWDPAWHRFDEEHHNCFTFCLGFINSVLAAEGRSPVSRDTFTHSFILPRMRRVTKYTTLYRHIQRHQYYMVDRQQDTAAKPDIF